MPDTPDPATPETILAFDYGLRRIGVAIGQSVTGSASPLGIIANGPDGIDATQLSALLTEWRPSRLVVGLPMHADGSPSDLQQHVAAFVELLGEYALPVEMVDERYTSVEAEAALKNARAGGRRGRITRATIDAAAAVFIAERYLAARAASV